MMVSEVQLLGSLSVYTNDLSATGAGFICSYTGFINYAAAVLYDAWRGIA